MATCLSCSTPLSRKGKYCNNKCQADFAYKQYIEDWKAGLVSGAKYIGEVSNHVRRYLHECSNSSCIKCGWSKINPVTQLVPLTVNHIDGNWDNHRPENLELLCPNCHALTPNFGSLNRGKGRVKR